MTTNRVEAEGDHPEREGDAPEGIICKDCGERFFLDYLDKPERHEGSGMCWLCFAYGAE